MSSVTDLGFISPEESIDVERTALNSSGSDVWLFSRDVPTVSLGAFNSEADCIDTGFITDNDIRVIRRISGGSAVYTDRDQIVFTYATDRARFKDKNESYTEICGALIRTLSFLGIEAEYKPVNDVLVNGMKISGCAQYRDRGRLLHHGTLILRLNSLMMDSSLIPKKKRKYGRLTSVEECLGYVPDRKEILKAFEEGFQDLIS